MSPRVIEALERLRDPGASVMVETVKDMVKPAASFPYGPAGVHVYVTPEAVTTWQRNGWNIGPATVRGHVSDPGHVVMFRGMGTRVAADVIAATLNELRGFAPEPNPTTEPLDGYLQAHGDAVQAFAAAHEALQRYHADVVKVARSGCSGGAPGAFVDQVPAGSRAAMLRFADEVHTAAAKLWRAS